MAGSSLLTLLDDIATLLDDISVMGKLAAKNRGRTGDDLSLNAQQVTGVRANRELPVVWSVAKGSLINKVILVPLALLMKRRTKNAKAFHDKCENFSFRASNETAVLITAFIHYMGIT